MLGMLMCFRSLSPVKSHIGSIVIFGLALPRLQRLWIAERAASAAHAIIGSRADTTLGKT
jgi:hypothetical protein